MKNHNKNARRHGQHSIPWMSYLMNKLQSNTHQHQVGHRIRFKCTYATAVRRSVHHHFFPGFLPLHIFIVVYFPVKRFDFKKFTMARAVYCVFAKCKTMFAIFAFIMRTTVEQCQCVCMCLHWETAFLFRCNRVLTTFHSIQPTKLNQPICFFFSFFFVLRWILLSHIYVANWK